MNVIVYCVRTANYYGLGLTPDDAVAAHKKVSCKSVREIQKYGLMQKLPEGVACVWVDEMGALNWEFPTYAPKEIRDVGTVKLTYNSKTRKWELPTVSDEQPTDDRPDGSEPCREGCDGNHPGVCE